MQNSDVKIKIIPIKNPNTNEIIIGQGNFTIKTIDDFYDVLFGSAQGIEFGVAMNEAKPRLVRATGNNEELKKLAAETALAIGAGHVFVIYLKNAFPIHVLNAIKQMPTVASVLVASSNPLEAVVAETSLGKALLGFVDGSAAEKIENETERQGRKELVKKLGFL